MKKIYTLILFLLSINLFAQTFEPAKLKLYSKIADSISRYCLTEQAGYKMLAELSKIGPRMNGSENLEKAIEWAKAKMQSFGFDNIILQPVYIPNWKRGNIEEAIISKSKYHQKRKLRIAALGNSIPTDKNGIEAEVLEVKSFEELRQQKDKAQGKIIFFNRPLDIGLVNTFEGYGGAVGQRSQGAVEAAKIGGVFALVRSVTTKNDNVPHVGTMHYEENIQKIPSAAIGSLDADFLSEALKKEPNLKIKIRMNCSQNPDVISYNVIGDIKGVEHPDEIIAVGGHFDSWDQGDASNDDGAGCVQSIEVLKIFKDLNLKPKRTIRCILFANEENGISGALGYKALTDSLHLNHLALIEADRGAGTPRGFYVTTDSVSFNKLQNFLPILNRVKIDWVRKGGSGADVGQIRNAKALFGYASDEQRYMDYHHSANDVFENVHPRELELGSAAMALLTYLLSEEGL